jgi:uncharacterized membrane protein
MRSKIRLLGHPIHPMLVAYPIALYTATLVAAIVAAAGGDPFVFRLAVVANVAGVGMAVLAAIPGFLDWLLAIPAATPAKTTGLLHMGLNVAALVLFAVNAVIHVGQWNDPARDTVLFIVLAAAGVLCTIGAGFAGWSLVQTHHVGIELTPEQRRLEPAAGGLAGEELEARATTTAAR